MLFEAGNGTGYLCKFQKYCGYRPSKSTLGIAQIEKRFAMRLLPNFIFRSREFEQMEIEYFIPPGDEHWPRYHREWIDARSNGLNRLV